MEQSGAADEKKKKRPRVAAACVMCRLSRLACDGQQPCERCAKGGVAASCVYVEQKKRGRPSRRSKAEKVEAPVSIVPVPAALRLSTGHTAANCAIGPTTLLHTPAFPPASALGDVMRQARLVGAPPPPPSQPPLPSAPIVADVVVELLSKEVQKAREEMRATQMRLKEIESENQALRQQSARAGPEMTAAARRQHILNQMRFLSEYDLASPDVPFVVDDLDNKPVAVIKVTLKQAAPMTCIFANQAFCSLVGCTMSELVGERAITTIVHDYRSKVKLFSLAMSSRGERVTAPVRLSILLIHKDGTLIRMASTAQLFRLSDGQPRNMVRSGAHPLVSRGGVKLGWNVISFDEMENVESMASLERSCPRIYARLMAFSQEASMIGSVEEVTERRKEVIRTCEREEWRELLLPLCSPTAPNAPRTLLALISDPGGSSSPLPPIQIHPKAVITPVSASSSPASTTPDSSPASYLLPCWQPPGLHEILNSPDQPHGPPQGAPYSQERGSLYAQQQPNVGLSDAAAATGYGEEAMMTTTMVGGGPRPEEPPLSPLYQPPTSAMSPIQDFSALLDHPDLSSASWLD